MCINIKLFDVDPIAESWRRGGISTRNVPVSVAPTRSATQAPSVYMK